MISGGASGLNPGVRAVLNLCSWVDKDGLKQTSSCHQIQVIMRGDPVIRSLLIT
jgi:hypothetical protein